MTSGGADSAADNVRGDAHPNETALEMRGIRKRFGDVVALDGVDLRVATGSVHALLGENGAGKTTLMRIAYGLAQPDAGSTRVFGHGIHSHSVRQAMRKGIGMVHQHLSLVPNLTAAENLALGEQAHRFHPAEAQRRLEEAGGRFGLPVPARALAQDLSIVEQQRLEILKALSRGARLLILDEPTAVLAPPETQDLLRWLRSYANDGGSVVLITHKLRDALAISDELTVLRRGRVAYRGDARLASEADVSRAMLPEVVRGESGSVPEGRAAAATATDSSKQIVVQANGVAIVDGRGVRRIHEATFQVRRHEIVGVAAVEGSGHRELLRALSGRLATAAGILTLPADISLIPADRLRDALIPAFTLTENVALRGLGARRGFMPWPALRARTRELASRFHIVARSADAPASTLSGGNQQRLVVARELERDVALVVADNPTRGLDIRATTFVHEQLRAAAEAGAAVVVHSSDLDEVLALSHRVLVVFAGAVREVAGGAETIGRAMLGVDVS